MRQLQCLLLLLLFFADCAGYTITAGNITDGDEYIGLVGVVMPNAFTLDNAILPLGAKSVAETAYANSPPLACPIVDTSSGSPEVTDVCDGESVDFQIVVDDSTEGSMRWDLTQFGGDAGFNGTKTATTYDLTVTFNSAGCKETQVILWELLCDDGTVVDSGQFLVNIYTVPTATVSSGSDGLCVAGITLDCPGDGIDVTWTDDSGLSGTTTAYNVLVNTTGQVCYELNNPIAPTFPTDCSSAPAQICVPYNCVGDCPFAGHETMEELCEDGNANLPTTANALSGFTDINNNAVPGTFGWYLVDTSGNVPVPVDPDTDTVVDGTALIASEACVATEYVFEAFVECNNIGATPPDSWIFLGTHTVLVYPEIDYEVSQATEPGNTCPTVTVTPACPGVLVTIAGTTNVGNPDVTFVTPGDDPALSIRLRDLSLPDICNEVILTEAIVCGAVCPTCVGETSPGICVFTDNFEFCETDPADDEFLPKLDMPGGFFVMSTGITPTLAFYKDTLGTKLYVPGLFTPVDNCTPSENEIYIFIECQGDNDKEFTGASFNISVYPDPADQTTTVVDDAECGPSLTWECDDGVAGVGWEIDNDYDPGSGATPDFSSESLAGAVTFTITNTSINDPSLACAETTVDATYNCSNCGGGSNPFEEFICGTESVNLPEFSELDISDPSGTLVASTFGWYDEGKKPTDPGQLGFTWAGGFELTFSHGGSCDVEAPVTIEGWVNCVDPTGVTPDLWIEVASYTYTIFPEFETPFIMRSVDALGNCDYVIEANCPTNDILSVTAFGPQSSGDPSGSIMIDVTGSNSDNPCAAETFAVPYEACSPVGCPSSDFGLAAVQELCSGESITLPVEGVDFEIFDDYSSLVAGSFNWYTSGDNPNLGNLFTLTIATHSDELGGCEPETTNLFAFVDCVTPSGAIEPAQVAAHIFTVYPPLRIPEIVRLDSQCNYEIIPACPDDILAPNEFGPLDEDTDGGTITVEVSNMTNSCPPPAIPFEVPYEGCPPPPPTLTIPTAFSPNGDNVNDRFYLFGEDVESSILYIYDRWGTQVYDSDAILIEGSSGDPGIDGAIGWRGTYDGEDAPMGLYVFRAEVNFTDGSSGMRTGNITLIR